MLWWQTSVGRWDKSVAGAAPLNSQRNWGQRSVQQNHSGGHERRKSSGWHERVVLLEPKELVPINFLGDKVQQVCGVQLVDICFARLLLFL